MPHQNHLQYHLLPYTAYMIIAKHKQIGWPNIKQSYVYKTILYPINYTKKNSLPSSHMAITMFWYHKHIKGNPPFPSTWPQPCWPCSTSSCEYLKMSCWHTYQPQPIEHVRETMLWITHRNVRRSSQYEHSL